MRFGAATWALVALLMGCAGETPSDDTTDDTSDTEVTGNQKPPAPSPRIEPSPAYVGDTLRVVWDNVEDPDGDVLEYAVRWETDDTSVAFDIDEREIPGEFVVKGQTWSVKVFARDGTARGPAGEASVTVSNSPPELTPVTLAPLQPTAYDRISATTNAEDADGDKLTLTFTWKVNGTEVLSGVGERNLPPRNHSKDDVVQLTVTASDGDDDTTRTSDTLTVINSAPGAPQIRFTPAYPGDGDPLNCEIVGAADDPDGDALTYTMVFEEDRTPFRSEQGLSVGAVQTVPAARTQPGEVFTCIVRASDGTDFGTTAYAAVTIDSAPPDLADVALGEAFSCAVRDADGRVACWGDNLLDRANGPGNDLAFVDVALGSDFGCGRVEDGTLSCWGGAQGRVNPPEGTYIALDSDGAHSCAIATDLSLACWGTDAFGESTPPDDMSARAVTVGLNHGCAIDNGDSSITCWGRDNLGQVTGTPTGAFSTISAGQNTTCAVDASGGLSCWGDDTYGQATAPSGTFADVAVGNGFACARSGAGDVTCWGLDTYGQTSPPAGTWAQIWTGGGHACAQESTGGIACWGDPLGEVLRVPYGTYSDVSVGTAYTCVVNEAQLVECFGVDTQGETLAPFGTFVSVDANITHTCGLQVDGTASCWGLDGAGQLTLPGASYADVSTGGTHTCALDPFGDLDCVGSVLLGPLMPSNPRTYIDVDAGSSHTCALDEDGAAQCWGNSAFAIYGLLQSRPGPFSSITSGDLHNCAVRDPEGTVVCWGSFGNNGWDQSATFTQVAAGTTATCGVQTNGELMCWEAAIAPTGVRNEPEGTFIDVSVGSVNACALDADGHLHCWGATVRQPLDD